MTGSGSDGPPARSSLTTDAPLDGSPGFDLTGFRLEDMVRLGSEVRLLGLGAECMEPVADEVVRHLYDHLRIGPDGDRACALVRLYKTHPYADLDDSLRAEAHIGLRGATPPPGMKCLTLLATAGDEPGWNARRDSRGHQAIPLVSQEQVDGIPMVAQLIHQFGLPTASVLAPDPAIMLDLEQRTYNVFHVQRALGSPFIPAQAHFVEPYGIASVLGFGGILPSGDLMAVLLFARVPIPSGTADLFKTIALNIKVALLPHDGDAVFAAREPTIAAFDRMMDARVAALTQLLDVQEHTALVQTGRLQAKNRELVIALEQLRAAQAQLVARERLASLGALTAGIAHEIKNPLNFVTNFAQLATGLVEELTEEIDGQGDRLDAVARDNLADLLADLQLNTRKILEHGRRADGIVGTMLQHSRGEAARSRATDLNELLRRYTDLAYHGLRAQDATFQVAIRTDFDPNVGAVDLIPEHLSRVVLNLVNNACYAAHRKRCDLGDSFRPTVAVGSRALGEMVEIRVDDNGGGIPAAIRERIFDPFFTTKPAGIGTGLGLSLSHDIVVGGHRGELRVESTEGEGATFIVTIPRSQAG